MKQCEFTRWIKHRGKLCNPYLFSHGTYDKPLQELTFGYAKKLFNGDIYAPWYVVRLTRKFVLQHCIFIARISFCYNVLSLSSSRVCYHVIAIRYTLYCTLSYLVNYYFTVVCRYNYTTTLIIVFIVFIVTTTNLSYTVVQRSQDTFWFWYSMFEHFSFIKSFVKKKKSRDIDDTIYFTKNSILS